MATAKPIDLPTSLIAKLQKRAVIPFVGAGLSRAVLKAGTKEPLFPNWHELLVNAAAHLKGEQEASAATRVEEALAEGDYLEAARTASERLGAREWSEFLRKQIGKVSTDADPRSLRLAELVWRWGSRFVITTNYDTVLRWACHENRDVTELRISQAAELGRDLGEIDKPTVWHLHGHIDDAAKLILAPDGYRKLYTEGVGEADYRAALATLRTVLSHKTLLFIGFSFDDAFVRHQIEWAQEIFQGFAGPHYALVQADRAPRFRHDFKDLGIKPIPFEGFGEPLVRRALELARAARGIEPHDGSDHGRLAEWLAMAYDSPKVMHSVFNQRLKKKLPKLEDDETLGSLARTVVTRLKAQGPFDESLFKLLENRSWSRDELAVLKERLVAQPAPVVIINPGPITVSHPVAPPSISELTLDRKKAWTTLEKEIKVPDGPQQAQLHVIYGSKREDLHLFDQRIKIYAQTTFGCMYLDVNRWDDVTMANTGKEWGVRASRTGELGRRLVELTLHHPLLLLFMERGGPLKESAAKAGLPEFIHKDLLPAIAKRKHPKHKVHIVLVLELDDPTTPPSIDDLCAGAPADKLQRHAPIRVEPPTWDNDIEPFIRDSYQLGNAAIKRIHGAYSKRRLEEKSYGELTRELDALISTELKKQK